MVDTKTFLEHTQIVHDVVTAKDENGLTTQHKSKDVKMYPTKGDMDTEDKIQTS